VRTGGAALLLLSFGTRHIFQLVAHREGINECGGSRSGSTTPQITHKTGAMRLNSANDNQHHSLRPLQKAYLAFGDGTFRPRTRLAHHYRAGHHNSRQHNVEKPVDGGVVSQQERQVRTAVQHRIEERKHVTCLVARATRPSTISNSPASITTIPVAQTNLPCANRNAAQTSLNRPRNVRTLG
jgi:hypothetical protein